MLSYLKVSENFYLSALSPQGVAGPVEVQCAARQLLVSSQGVGPELTWPPGWGCRWRRSARRPPWTWLRPSGGWTWRCLPWGAASAPPSWALTLGPPPPRVRRHPEPSRPVVPFGHRFSHPVSFSRPLLTARPAQQLSVGRPSRLGWPFLRAAPDCSINICTGHHGAQHTPQSIVQ